jgi:hypothetical protein
MSKALGPRLCGAPRRVGSQKIVAFALGLPLQVTPDETPCTGQEMASICLVGRNHEIKFGTDRAYLSSG